jgi:hypothetical protein
VDHVDGDLVLLAVLGRGQQRGRQPLVGGGVATAGRGAGHGVRADHVAGDRHQELGAGGHEAADAHQVAAGVGGPQALQHHLAVEGHVGGDVDLAGQHHLVERPAGHDLGGPLHQLAPGLRAHLCGHRVPLGLSTGMTWPHQGDVARATAAGLVGQQLGDPTGPVFGAPDHHLGHHQAGGAAGNERQGAERHGTGPGDTDLVVGLDGGQRLSCTPGRGGGVARRPVHREGLAAAGQAGAALLEHEAFAAGEGHQVDVGVQPPGTGNEAHGVLVPVTSWAMPPDSRRRSTPSNPAAEIIASISPGGGR